MLLLLQGFHFLLTANSPALTCRFPQAQCTKHWEKPHTQCHAREVKGLSPIEELLSQARGCRYSRNARLLSSTSIHTLVHCEPCQTQATPGNLFSGTCSPLIDLIPSEPRNSMSERSPETARARPRPPLRRTHVGI